MTEDKRRVAVYHIPRDTCRWCLPLLVAAHGELRGTTRLCTRLAQYGQALCATVCDTDAPIAGSDSAHYGATARQSLGFRPTQCHNAMLAETRAVAKRHLETVSPHRTGIATRNSTVVSLC